MHSSALVGIPMERGRDTGGKNFFIQGPLDGANDQVGIEDGFVMFWVIISHVEL